MRKIVTVMAAAALALALAASSAVAGGHDWHEGTPPHPHVMLVGADVDEGILTFRNCVDFDVDENAGTGDSGALPTPAHHHSVHTGQTGKAGGSPLVGGPLYQAGNWVIPMDPYLPPPFAGLTGCESFTSGMDWPFPF